MERIIQNGVETNSFHLVNGAFAESFYNEAIDQQKIAVKLEVPDGSSFDFNNLVVPPDAEIICITQNETSTGVSIDPTHISELKEKYPDKLIAVDTVSSVPYVDLDYSKIDYAFFSGQKGPGIFAGQGSSHSKSTSYEESP